VSEAEQHQTITRWPQLGRNPKRFHLIDTTRPPRAPTSLLNPVLVDKMKRHTRRNRG